MKWFIVPAEFLRGKGVAFISVKLLLRQMVAGITSRFPSFSLFSYVFLYAWVCMTFSSGSWFDWSNITDSVRSLLPVFSNIPALLIFAFVAIKDVKSAQLLSSPKLMIGAGCIGTAGCLMMVAASVTGGSDVLFLAGCLVADCGTAPVTIVLARIFAQKGPRTTIVFIALSMILSLGIWFVCLAVPLACSRAVYILLPLLAASSLSVGVQTVNRSRETSSTQTSPSFGYGDFLRFVIVFAFFSCLAGIAMSFFGGDSGQNGGYEVAYFWVMVLAAAIAVVSLSWFHYKTVERLYYALALCEVATLISAVFLGFDERFLFVPLTIANTIFDALSWCVISAAAYSAAGRQLRIVAIGRFAFPFGSTVGWLVGQFILGSSSAASNLMAVCGVGTLMVVIGFTVICTSRSLSRLVAPSLSDDKLDKSELDTSLVEAHANYLNLKAEQLAIRFGLTRRERELLVLMIEGYTNTSMAEKLFISENTVKTHVKHVYQKLGVKNREELHALANSNDNDRRV